MAAHPRSPWLRRILIGTGAILLLLVVAAGVLIATFDANRYKVLAVDWMRDTHQRTLVIAGPVELSVFPRLAVQVSKLSLSEVSSAEQFLAVDRAELSVAVLPLLRKQLIIDRITASGVAASYRRDDKGVRNFDDFITTPDGPAAPEVSASAATGSALAFDVSAVMLDDLRLKVRDEKAALEGELSLQSFTSGRLAPGVVTPITLKAALQMRRPQAMALQLDGSGNLSLDLRKNALSISGLSLAVKGDAAAATALALTLTGDVAWDGRAAQAGPLKLQLESGTFGTVKLGATTLELERALLSPEAQRVELQALKLASSGQFGASPFTLALDWPKLTVDGQQIAGSAISGRFGLGGESAVNAAFQSKAPAGRFDALKLPGVAVTVDAALGARKIVGQLGGDLLLTGGNQTAAGAVFDNLTLSADLSDPGLAPLKLSLGGRVNVDATPEARAAGWSVRGSLNANRFETEGTAALSRAVPRVIASGRFDSLDLNTLTGPGNSAAAVAVAPAETTVDLSALKRVDGRFDLSAGALAFRQYRVSDARLVAALDGGTLQVSRLTGRAWGGSVQASGRAEAAGNRVAVDLTADGVDVGALLKNVADKDLLSGTGRVSAELRTGGATLGAMRSALAGTAQLNVRDGAVKGFNLAQSLRQAKAMLTGRQDMQVRASAAEQTDFSALGVSAAIEGGVARSNDLELKSPFLRIGGDGLFDIGRGRIDYTARATAIRSAKGQGGADLAALQGVTVPVRLTGPLDAVEWQILWSQVAAKAVEARIKEKLNDKLGELLGATRDASADASASQPASARDQLTNELKNQLKGLFK